jgi:mevalonate kinase
MRSLLVKAQACGKVILFGEYAAIYGHKAYAQALPHTTCCSVNLNTDHDDTAFFLKNLMSNYRKSFTELFHDYKKIQENHHLFLQSLKPIESVLPSRSSLIEAIVADELGCFFAQGLDVSVDSTVALGSGQGSSASLILSVLLALKTALGRPINPTTLFQQARKLESYQHGYSSGLDIATVLHGGLIAYTNGTVEPLVPLNTPFYLVSTGEPVVSTGQSVAFVKSHWNADHEQEYRTLDLLIQRAFFNADVGIFCEAIQYAHRWLTKLGVVPKSVFSFITAVEKSGGVAKISGSGSVAGERAGTVLVFDCSTIEQLCLDYGYSYELIEGVGTGVTSL